ncbi:MAG: hypothetical protein KAQ93_01170 [Spirochaetales bacterium]|nr:hypothetical protein [Spirochaetales bacterium]
MRPVRSYITQIAIFLSAIMLFIISSVIIFLYWDVNGKNILIGLNNLTLGHSAFEVLYLIFIKNLFVFTVGLIFRNLFKKIASPEVFFFNLAILALSFTSLRSLFLVDGFLGYPVYLSETISRSVYLGKMITILCLFTSGLFSTGISFQKQQYFLLLIVLISFILSSVIPIDLYKTEVILLKGTGTEYGMNIIFIILQILAVLNFLVGAIKNNNYDYLYIALAVGMISLGNEILFGLIPGIASYMAIVSLISGTALFGYKIHKIYQWT